MPAPVAVALIALMDIADSISTWIGLTHNPRVYEVGAAAMALDRLGVVPGLIIYGLLITILTSAAYVLLRRRALKQLEGRWNLMFLRAPYAAVYAIVLFSIAVPMRIVPIVSNLLLAF